MAMDDVERVVAVDWSGRVDAAGQRRHIWAGVWTKTGSGERVTLEAGRTREELIAWLIAMGRETPRMVVGIDCCFSFPAWFLKEHGCATVFDFWQHVAAGHGERWLAREGVDTRFWGRPGKRNLHFIGATAAQMFRRADRDCKIRSRILDPALSEAIKGIAPKSPFQIGGAGAVGTGSLRGIPQLLRLREAGFSVWPFDETKMPIVLEIYPRLLTGEVKKNQQVSRRAYLSQRILKDKDYAELSNETLTKAFESEDAFDALVSVLTMARRRESFLYLQQTADTETLLEGAVWGAGAE